MIECVPVEIECVPVGKENKKCLRHVKVVPGELHHRLVVVDVEEQKLTKSVKKIKRVRWKVLQLKEKDIKQKFEERVVELLDTDSMDLWGSYKMEFYMLVINCVKIRKRGEIEETHNGRTSK